MNWLTLDWLKRPEANCPKIRKYIGSIIARKYIDSLIELDIFAPWSKVADYYDPDPAALKYHRPLSEFKRTSIPSKSGRILLESGQYINADCVEVGKECLIACEAPRQTTVSQFAEMTLRLNVPLIVSFNVEGWDEGFPYWESSGVYAEYSIYPHPHSVSTGFWDERDLLIIKNSGTTSLHDGDWPSTREREAEAGDNDPRRQLVVLSSRKMYRLTFKKEGGAVPDILSRSPNWESCTAYGRSASNKTRVRHINFTHRLDDPNRWVHLFCALVLRSRSLVKDYSPSSAPVLVHCPTGVERTGAFITMWLGMTYVSQLVRYQATVNPKHLFWFSQRRYVNRHNLPDVKEGINSGGSAFLNNRGLAKATKFIVEEVRASRNGAVPNQRLYVMIYRALKFYYQIKHGDIVVWPPEHTDFGPDGFGLGAIPKSTVERTESF